MALALVQGMLRAKLCAAADVIVSDRVPAATENMVSATGVRKAANNAEAVRAADVVLLCTKPGDAADALAEADGHWAGKLLISIVAGMKISALQGRAPGARVVRVMPNTAALVGMSATAVAAAEDATRDDAATAENIFQAVGKVFAVSESQLDAVTGLSGSGPAYIYLVMEALSDGGVAVGLPRKLALELAIQTVQGAAEMASATREHPAVLREMVTSPGGTTIAALAELEQAAVRAAFIQAVQAAAARSKELGAG